jgi:hypothetical protein
MVTCPNGDGAIWSPDQIASAVTLPRECASALLQRAVLHPPGHRLVFSAAAQRGVLPGRLPPQANRPVVAPQRDTQAGPGHNFLATRSLCMCLSCYLCTCTPSPHPPPWPGHSSPLQLDLTTSLLCTRPGPAQRQFFTFVQSCFAQKRKMLKNNLKAVCDEDTIVAALDMLGR